MKIHIPNSRKRMNSTKIKVWGCRNETQQFETNKSSSKKQLKSFLKPRKTCSKSSKNWKPASNSPFLYLYVFCLWEFFIFFQIWNSDFLNPEYLFLAWFYKRSLCEWGEENEQRQSEVRDGSARVFFSEGRGASLEDRGIGGRLGFFV